MTSRSGPLAARFGDLLAAFNAETLDLPDGVLHKDCVFRLNGRAYDEHLGLPPGDPLTRLIGCGPAGYRLILTRLRFALASSRISLDESTLREDAAGARGPVLVARGTVSGVLRGAANRVSAPCSFTVTGDSSGVIREIAVTLGDADVELLMAARLRA
jgi:hypothetical protein